MSWQEDYNPTIWNNGDLIDQEKLSNIENGISNINEKINILRDNFILEYQTDGYNYNIGDLCWYEGKIYRCTTPHSGGVWNDSYWAETNIMDELESHSNEVKDELIKNGFLSSLIQKKSSISKNTTNTYHIYWNWSNEQLTVYTDGDSPAAGVNNLVESKSAIPSFLKEGSKIYIKYKSNFPNDVIENVTGGQGSGVWLSILFYTSNSSSAPVLLEKRTVVDDICTIPTGAKYWSIRVYKRAGQAIDENNPHIVELDLFSEFSEEGINNNINEAINSQAVKYNISQTLTEENKFVARKNIDTIGNKESLWLGNISYILKNHTNATTGNVIYTWNGDVCTITTTTAGEPVDADHAYNFISPINGLLPVLPEEIQPGDIIYYKYVASDNKVSLSFTGRTESGASWASSTGAHKVKPGEGFVVIPTSAYTFGIRLYVDKDTVFDTPTVISDIQLYKIPSYFNEYLTKNQHNSALQYMGLAGFKIADQYSAGNEMEPKDMPFNSYCYTSGDRIKEFGSDITSSMYVWIIKLQRYYNNNIQLYIVINNSTKEIKFGTATANNNNITWFNVFKKHYKILSIGSSFGQDATVYTPFLMKEICPEISVTFGIVYKNGGTIVDYINMFNNYQQIDETGKYLGRPDIYSIIKPYSTNWSNYYQSKEFKDILKEEDWDIICINQGAASGNDLKSFERMDEYLNMITDFIGRPVKFGYLMPQAATGTTSYSYEELVNCAKTTYENNNFSFFIPSGTAIENARHTILNDREYLGTYFDGLTADGQSNDGRPQGIGHLQEGAPVLISNYVATMILLEQMGSKKSVMGSLLAPTADWVGIPWQVGNTAAFGKRIPGQNPAPTTTVPAARPAGVVGPQYNDITPNITASKWNAIRKLGQKCAIAAIKSPYKPTLTLYDTPAINTIAKKEISEIKNNSDIAVQIYSEFEYEDNLWREDGSMTTNSARYKHTKPVEIIPNTVYYTTYYVTLSSVTSPGYAYGVFYDENGSIIKVLNKNELVQYNYNTPNGDPDTATSFVYVNMYKFTSPANAKYFSLNVDIDSSIYNYRCSFSNIPVYRHSNTGNLIIRKTDTIYQYYGKRKLCVIGPSTVMIDRLFRSNGNFNNNGILTNEYVVGFQEYLIPYWSEVRSFGYSGAGYGFIENPNSSNGEKISIDERILGSPEGYTHKCDPIDLSEFDDFLILSSGNPTPRFGEAIIDPKLIPERDSYMGALRQLIKYIYDCNHQAMIYLSNFRYYAWSLNSLSGFNTRFEWNKKIEQLALILGCKMVCANNSGFNHYTQHFFSYDTKNNPWEPTASEIDGPWDPDTWFESNDPRCYGNGHFNHDGSRIMGEHFRKQIIGI